MTKMILVASAILYWVCFLGRLYLWNKEWTPLERKISYLEKLSLLVFTSGLVFYIGKLQIVAGEVRSQHYDMPVSFLLFAWTLSASNLVTEIAYGNRWSALFSNFWNALALTLSPAAAIYFQRVFTYDLQWLSFHRLCFLLGYAFCVLALPLVLFFFFNRWREQNEKQLAQADQMDRMLYRMILWALPLLTAGIIVEAILLLETNQLPSPEEIWTQKTETLLALATWFLCGIYLHTRLFFGWKRTKSAALYLFGLGVILLGHILHSASHLQPPN